MKSLQIRVVGREGLYLSIYTVREVEQSTSTIYIHPARFAPMILANRVPHYVWGGGYYTCTCIIGANRAGKSTRSLFNCISVMDGIKINEQYKSIGIGPLYL